MKLKAVSGLVLTGLVSLTQAVEMHVSTIGLDIDQLFIEGVNQRMARYPNYDAAKKTAAYQGFGNRTNHIL